MLYFVDYVKGKNFIFLDSPALFLVFASLFPLYPPLLLPCTSLAPSTLRQMHFIILLFVCLAPGGDLNQSAAARAKLQKEATSDAE